MNHLVRASTLSAALLIAPLGGTALAVDQSPPPQTSAADWQQRLLTNAVMGTGVLVSADGEQALFAVVAGPTSDTGHNKNGTFTWAERSTSGDAYAGGIQDYAIQNGVATINGSGPYIEPDGSKHGVQFTLVITPGAQGAGQTLSVTYAGSGYNETWRGTLQSGFVDVGVGSADPATLRRQMDGSKSLANELQNRMNALKQLSTTAPAR